jgi:hypothetical protein
MGPIPVFATSTNGLFFATSALTNGFHLTVLVSCHLPELQKSPLNGRYTLQKYKVVVFDTFST